MTETDTPTYIRRLDTGDAARLARLVGAYDDLQTVLRCCERLLPMLQAVGPSADDLGIEAMWTLAVLSYGRAFSSTDSTPAALGEADLVNPSGELEVVKRHRLLMHLRDHHADATANPRETYTVGVGQDADGAVNAVAVTSVPSARVDAEAVLQAGRTVLPLCAVLDERIAAVHKTILQTAKATSRAEIEALDRIEVAANT